MNSSLSTQQVLLREIVCGSAAGVFAQFCVYPMDLIRTRVQVSHHSQRSYRSISNCIFLTFREEGVFGFYKGMASPLLFQVLYKSTIFGISKYLQNRWHGQHASTSVPLSTIFFSAGIAGGVNAIWVTPAELFRSRLQVVYAGSNSSYNGLISCVQFSLSHGFLELWKGLIPTIARDMPGVATWFASFEASKRYLLTNSYSYSSLFYFCNLVACGSIAGMSYWAVAYPFDCVKSIVQTSTSNKGMTQVALDLYRQGGVSRFYKGFPIAFLRGIPSSGVMFSSFTLFADIWNRKILKI